MDNYEQNIAKWAEALINGEYEQGKNLLFNPDNKCYCVNGVAAVAVGGMSIVDEAIHYGSRPCTVVLPNFWYDRTFGGRIPNQGFFAELNDSGFSFAEIAARLVSYLPDGKKKAELQTLIKAKLTAEKGQLVDITV